MSRAIFAVVTGLLAMNAPGITRAPEPAPRGAAMAAAPVIEWSHEARRAIVPPGPDGIFGRENYGNKFPGEAAVYMGVVHAAMFDAVVAIAGGYRPYAVTFAAPAGASPEAAVATAAHHVLIGLQPALGLDRVGQATLDARYDTYLERIPDGQPKANGITIGAQVASAVLALRAGDGREREPRIADLEPPSPGAGVWDPGPAAPLGLRLAGMRPLALQSGSQMRPDGPDPLTSAAYRDDFREVAELGRADSARRRAEQTTAALFWTDHDVRQWNDALVGLAVTRELDLVQAARMLAMAHAAGGDAMIACFDAKYTYWFWRPYQAIPRADTDGNAATEADAAWRPLRATPNFPEYPSAHACHSAAIAEALSTFFGTDQVRLTLDSRVTSTTREYARLEDVVRDVDWARVLVGFHFRNSDQEGARLGRAVARYVVAHKFQPLPDSPGRAATGRGGG